jgi:hypothetical protein
MMVEAQVDEVCRLAAQAPCDWGVCSFHAWEELSRGRGAGWHGVWQEKWQRRLARAEREGRVRKTGRRCVTGAVVYEVVGGA